MSVDEPPKSQGKVNDIDTLCGRKDGSSNVTNMSNKAGEGGGEQRWYARSPIETNKHGQITSLPLSRRRQRHNLRPAAGCCRPNSRVITLDKSPLKPRDAWTGYYSVLTVLRYRREQ